VNDDPMIQTIIQWWGRNKTR